MTSKSLEQESVAMQTAVEGGTRTFAVVAIGQIVSIFGSSLTAFALGAWIYLRTNSVTYLGLVILAASIPGVMISPLAGSLVDRWNRRRVMLAANLTMGWIELIMWGLIVREQVNIGYFFVLAAANSVAAAFHEPAFTASIPLLVPKRNLSRAAGLVQLGQAIAQIITPALAGVMVATVGVGPVLLADAGTFLIATMTLLLVQIPRPKDTAEGSKGKGSLWGESVRGWSYLRERSGLIRLLVLFALVNPLLGCVNLLFIPLVLSFASPRVLGAVLTIGGTGMLLGSMGVMALGAPKHKIRALMGLIFVGGLFISLSGVRASAALIAASGFVMMLVLPILQTTSQVLWQTKIAPDVQGRVFALRRMLQQASLPLAYLIAGPLADNAFEPLMSKGGTLAPYLGYWIGVGPGRGIGLMLILTGMAGCLLAVFGYLHPRIRHIEQEVPDTIADTAV
jgi:MFS transporter, DHA3 family, macrolide efflux protein